MQDQRRRETTNYRARRSVGELIAGWFVLMWGVLFFVYILSSWVAITNPLIFVIALCQIVHTLSCFSGGLCALLRYRILAKWLLFSAAFCLGVVVLFWMWIVWRNWVDGHYFNLVGIAFTFGILLLTCLYAFLGNWFGNQEDMDSSR